MFKKDRVEIVKNRQGKDELFVTIEIDDEELDTYYFAKWLIKNEFKEYEKDKLKLDKIIERYLPIAKQNKKDEIEYIKNHTPILEGIK